MSQTQEIDKTAAPAVEEPLDRRGRIRLTIAIIGALLGLASMLTILGIVAWSNRSYEPLKSQVTVTPDKIQALKDLSAQDEAILSAYGRDPVTDDRRIPINVAMEKIIADYQQSAIAK